MKSVFRLMSFMAMFLFVMCLTGCGKGSGEGAPVVSAVNGSGTADSATSHTSQHIRDRLVLSGKNLANAKVSLTGTNPTRPQEELKPCSAATDTEAQVKLPENIGAGAYTLTATNQAGECNTSLSLLQGEAGSFIGNGADVVGAINTAMATDPNLTISAVPVGIVLPFAGPATSLPTGWLLCDGSEIARTTYARLFNVVGITYGGGDGINTFNLPDLRGRAIIGAGQGAGLTSRTLGQTLGEEAHALTVSELAQHQHTGTTNPMNYAQEAYMEYNGPGTSGRAFSYITPTGVGADINLHTHAFTTNTTGSGAAHNTVPPSLVLSYIIKY